METKFNFNSQIATSREQSERLLALGLNKETADMVYYRSSSGGILATPWRDDYEGYKCYYPAWSLHRLIEMALRDVLICGISFNFDEDAYEKVIGIIEYQIEGGYFNKEYLV